MRFFKFLNLILKYDYSQFKVSSPFLKYFQMAAKMAEYSFSVDDVSTAGYTVRMSGDTMTVRVNGSLRLQMKVPASEGAINTTTQMENYLKTCNEGMMPSALDGTIFAVASLIANKQITSTHAGKTVAVDAERIRLSTNDTSPVESPARQRADTPMTPPRPAAPIPRRHPPRQEPLHEKAKRGAETFGRGLSMSHGAADAPDGGIFAIDEDDGDDVY